MNRRAFQHADRNPLSETTAHFRLIQMHRQRPRNACCSFSPIRIHLLDSPGSERMRRTAGFPRLIEPTVDSPMLLFRRRRSAASQAKMKRRNSEHFRKHAAGERPRRWSESPVNIRRRIRKILSPNNISAVLRLGGLAGCSPNEHRRTRVFLSRLRTAS